MLRWIGRIASRVPALDRRRLRFASAFIRPWEWPAVHGLPAARHYPRFRRGHDNEAEAVADMLVVQDYTMTKYDRCAVLHNLVKFIEDRELPGDLVECGVWKGGSSGMMALASRRYGRAPRRLWLFDSWEEWPDPTPADGERFEELLGKSLRKADNTRAHEACRRLLEEIIGYPPQHLTYAKGLFEQTIPAFEHELGGIALLRLDADWYEATRLCLERLYPKVVPGGIVVIDDYGWCTGCKRAVDEFRAAQPVEPFLHHVDYSCRYFFKPAASAPPAG